MLITQRKKNHIKLHYIPENQTITNVGKDAEKLGKLLLPMGM